MAKSECTCLGSRLKYFWVKYWETILAFLGLVTVIFILPNYDEKFYSQNFYLGAIAAIIALYVGILKVKVEHDKFEQSLFENFNGRYNSKLNDLLNKTKRKEDANKKSKPYKGKDKNLIIDYLNLCAEEYFWFKRGRISREIWLSWEAGIHQNIQLKRVKEVIEEEKKTDLTKRSYYEFFEDYT
jgi:hypothetical protein